VQFGWPGQRFFNSLKGLGLFAGILVQFGWPEIFTGSLVQSDGQFGAIRRAFWCNQTGVLVQSDGRFGAIRRAFWCNRIYKAIK